MRDVIATSLAGHQRRNAELVALIRQKGADLDELRVIECHFWMPSEQAAEKVVSALEAKGFLKLRVNEAEQSLWNVEMAITQSVKHTVSDGFTTDLIGIALMFDGKFDGWGTSLGT